MSSPQMTRMLGVLPLLVPVLPFALFAMCISG